MQEYSKNHVSGPVTKIWGILTEYNAFNEKTKAQRGQGSSLRLHSQLGVTLTPYLLDSKSSVLRPPQQR